MTLKEMYKRFIILVVIIVVCLSGKQLNNYVPKYSAKTISEKINHYYKSNSKDSLLLFLDEWHKTIPPVSEETINQNDTIANIYRLFIDLYKPFKFGNEETANAFENKNEYILIQNNIDYEVVSINRFQALKRSVNRTLANKVDQTKTLRRFRPVLNIEPVKYLYLTAEYNNGISDFLGANHNPAISEKERMNRLRFLTPELPIVQTHDGENWYIETFPIIQKITFDSNFKHAFVEFRNSIGQTITAYPVIKTMGHWKVDKYKILSIQQE